MKRGNTFTAEERARLILEADRRARESAALRALGEGADVHSVERTIFGNWRSHGARTYALATGVLGGKAVIRTRKLKEVA